MPDRARLPLVLSALILACLLLPWTATAQTRPRDPDDDDAPAAAASIAPPSHEEREAIEKLRTRAETSHFEATGS